MTLTAMDLTGEAYHHTPADVEALHELAGLCPEGAVMVNIGACFGTSTLALLEGNPRGYVFSIDVNLCQVELSNLKMAGVNYRSCRVLGESQVVGEYWPPRSLDLVFVDGSHTYQDVYLDAVIWRRALKPNGILAFHDVGTVSLPEVKVAVNDAMGKAVPFLVSGTIRAYRV